MSFSSTFINRPVLATVSSLVIVLFGIISYNFLSVREFPNVDPPIVTVTTDYIGANADVIESQITEPLEESINGIEGIKSMKSVSSDGRSSIQVEFDLSIDMEAAANDVRDRVSRAIRNIPADADPPIVVKSDADSDAILSLTIQSKERNLLDLTDIGINVFKERLQTIPGVSEIRIWGEKKYSIKLTIDPTLLKKYNLAVQDVRTALLRENVELPSGRIEGDRTELVIRTFGRLTTPEDFDNMIIKENENYTVKFKDIGYARLAPQNERSLLRGNGGIPMIGVALNPQPGTNIIEIADEFYKRVEQIKKEIPSDLVLGIAMDNTIPIRKAIKEVRETIFMAFFLVVLIIFLFLRNWRTTLIPVITIPISLIGVFFVMYIADFSINILTLLGIVLSTGLVVDDAIVVLENIYKKIEAGEDPKIAGHEGTKEIFFAIISTTVTLVAVFLPIVFLQGLTGRLFREFGVVVAGTIIISTFVSLSLTPMMSSKFLKLNKKKNKFFLVTEAFFEKLNDVYKNTLTAFLSQKWLAFVIMIASLIIILGIGSIIPSELAPMEDKGRLRIMSTAPEGTSFEMMDAYVDDLVALTDTLPEKESILSVTAPSFGSSISVNGAFLRIMLKDHAERKKSQFQLADEISNKLKKMAFARSFVIQEPTIGGGRMSGLPVQFVIQAPNFEKLKEKLPLFINEAQKSDKFSVVDLNLKFNKPELQIDINREKAALLGVNILDVAETLQLLYSGQRLGYFIMNNKQYEVIGEAAKNRRNQPSELNEIFIRNKYDVLIPLSTIISTTEKTNPPQLYRYNRYVSATVSAQPSGNLTVGQGIEEMRRIANDVLDDTFSTSLDGLSKEFEESSNSLLFAFLFALILVYLVLAAQFESFRDPLTIMFTVPLALAGALLSLWLFGHTLNIFSQIGVIVLIGIVTKNGILIVEFANQKKDQGLHSLSAVIDAATDRFRPILMTSLATVLGAVPIAFALGASSTSRVPMGVVIIGGLLFSLVLTLYVIPALYLYIGKKK